jgi:hypothetical protein
MALNPNQIQVTTIHLQVNEIIDRIHKVHGCQLYAQIIWLRK